MKAKPESGNQNVHQVGDPKTPQPTVGRIVQYFLIDGPNAGQPRPAIVVRVWPDALNLRVFTDGPNDGNRYAAGVYWATSVQPGTEPGQWSWPPREGA